MGCDEDRVIAPLDCELRANPIRNRAGPESGSESRGCVHVGSRKTYLLLVQEHRKTLRGASDGQLDFRVRTNGSVTREVAASAA